MVHLVKMQFMHDISHIIEANVKGKKSHHEVKFWYILKIYPKSRKKTKISKNSRKNLKVLTNPIGLIVENRSEKSLAYLISNDCRVSTANGALNWASTTLPRRTLSNPTTWLCATAREKGNTPSKWMLGQPLRVRPSVFCYPKHALIIQVVRSES